MNTASPDRIRQDRRLIGQTLLRLTLPRMVIRGVVLIVAAIIWLMVARWLLDFGRGINFEQFPAFGPQAIELITRINPWLWWVVVVIWSLIVFFMARAWMLSDIAAGRAKPLPLSDMSALNTQLSEEVTGVLRWVWGSREEPFTLGDLRQAHNEMRHGRIDKIELVREQSLILDRKVVSGARAAPTVQPFAPRRDASDQAPVVNTPADKPRAATHRIEPNL